MKKILVTQPSMPSYKEYCDEIKSIWDTRWLTNNGPLHEQLTDELIKYFDIKDNYISLVCNGHMALYNAIKVLNLEGEVITTPFTFVSTIHAIKQNGLKPVFCDIDPNDYTIDTDKIESLITDKTCAIVAVHVYGNPCHVSKIEDIAKKYNLKVIYDAAHAFGEKINNKSLLKYGDLSMLSFHATKVFNTIEGGAIVFSNKKYLYELDNLKNFGITSPENIEGIGFNCKMNEFQAAMGLCNLKHIDNEIEKRKKVYERYIKNLKGVKGIKLNIYDKNLKPNYSYFPIVVLDEYGLTRNELFNKLEENGYCARKYFYPLITDTECYNKDYDSNDTPIAKDISNRVMTLPMYADLSLSDVDKICEIIKNK